MSNSTNGASPKSARLFYTDPLRAIWMHARFGMRFQPDPDEDPIAEYEYTLLLAEADEQFTERYYIHPVSLGLLEPQELDILYRTNGYCQTVGVHIGFPKAKAQIDAGGCIIMRNGIAFHWPNDEASDAAA